MLTRILAAIGALWGGGILLSAFLGSGPEGSGAYAQGQAAGFIFGAVLFGVGMFYLIKGGKKSTPRK
jgi:hypothetical protein